MLNLELLVLELIKKKKRIISLVEAINNSILSLEKEHLELWNIFFEEWFLDAIMGFRKKDFKKKVYLTLTMCAKNMMNLFRFL